MQIPPFRKKINQHLRKEIIQHFIQLWQKFLPTINNLANNSYPLRLGISGDKENLVCAEPSDKTET